MGTVQVKRRVGPKRIPSTREGLARTQAAAELRRLIGSTDTATLQRERVTAEAVGALLIEHRRGHLRHTFGTRMAAQGVPMRALQEMMGHRDFKTTLIYAD